MTLTPLTPDEARQAWLEHLGWIRRLAVRLAKDEAGADDLVQRTALVALGRREAVNAAARRGSLRAWLRGILQNEARASWRKERNRTAREQAYASTRPAANIGPGDDDERLGLTKRVVAAVERLEEPYRTVILARYFDGRGVGEIALALSVPTRTIETQLRRGREKLRAELGRQEADGEARGSGASWAALALASWDKVPSAATVTATSATAAGTSLFPFLALMNIKAVLFVAAAVTAVWVGLDRWALPVTTPTVPSEVAIQAAALPGPSDLEPVHAPAVARESAAQIAEPEPREVEAATTSFLDELETPPPGTLDVWVVDEDDRILEGSKVTLVQGTLMKGQWGPPEVPADASRKVRVVSAVAPNAPPEPVRFEGLADGDWYVEVLSAQGTLYQGGAQLRPEAGANCVVRFGTATVFGRVVDPAAGRQPIPGAYLTLPHRHVLTDGQGRYRFEEVPAGKAKLWLYPYVMGEVTQDAIEIPRRFVELNVERGAELRVDFPPALEDGGAILRGRIVDAEGQVVTTPDFKLRHAEVWIKSRAEPRSDGEDADPTISLEQRSKYGLDGTFEMHLPSGEYDVQIMSPHRAKRFSVTDEAAMVLPPGEITSMDFTLPGVTLRGQMPTDVAVNYAERFMRGVGARQSHVTWPSGVHAGYADESGAFALFGLEPGEWIISAIYATYEAELTIREEDRSATAHLRLKEE